MRSKPNVEQFIAGGKGEDHKAAPPASKRKGKFFYLSLELWGALKQQAVTESQEKKSRVSESDVMERALIAYLASKA